MKLKPNTLLYYMLSLMLATDFLNEMFISLHFGTIYRSAFILLCIYLLTRTSKRTLNWVIVIIVFLANNILVSFAQDISALSYDISVGLKS